MTTASTGRAPHGAPTNTRYRVLGLTTSASGLALTRFLFGMGEAGAFPAGSRALVAWLPAERRAFGQGFQHSGSRLGAALAPLVVASLIAISGWRAVFVIFGVTG